MDYYYLFIIPRPLKFKLIPKNVLLPLDNPLQHYEQGVISNLSLSIKTDSPFEDNLKWVGFTEEGKETARFK